jgi:hypothetical protein
MIGSIYYWFIRTGKLVCRQVVQAFNPFDFFRVKHGPQESVPEGMFDDSIHLVVWGHEHDCRITPEPVAGKEYYITQPGSSVATSLADGESIEKYDSRLFLHEVTN